jgi:hypothetical protein
MTATAIPAQLEASGVSLGIVKPDRLRVEAPRGVVTPEVRATLQRYKSDIITELLERDEARRRAFFHELGCDPDRWREFETQMDERAAIMEIDGGLTRDQTLFQAELMTFEEWIN